MRAAGVGAVCVLAAAPAFGFAPAVLRHGGAHRSSGKVLVMDSAPSPITDIKGPGCIFPRDTAEGWFDTDSVGMPVVHRYLHDEGERWKMWYHGREHGFDQGIIDIGTGRIGTATSSDGIHWKREPGQMARNSVLNVNEEQWWGFDTAHVGLGDVTLGTSDRIQTEGGIYFMYYFGGDYEETDVKEQFGLSQAPAGGAKGTRMRIGVAVSQDGLNWSRLEGEHSDNSVLECGEEGEWDEMFVGWPSVINFQQKEFRMYYHSLDPRTKKFCVGYATSQDGLKWFKRNPGGKPVFQGGPEGAWDARGAGRRCVLNIGGVMHMFYEGVDADGVHAVGLATSRDGRTWERKSTDGPVFQRSAEAGAWDAGSVTSPRVLDLGDGDYWMFYVGYGEEKGGPGRIGVARSIGGDLTRWQRVTDV